MSSRRQKISNKNLRLKRNIWGKCKRKWITNFKKLLYKTNKLINWTKISIIWSYQIVINNSQCPNKEIILNWMIALIHKKLRQVSTNYTKVNLISLRILSSQSIPRNGKRYRKLRDPGIVYKKKIFYKYRDWRNNLHLGRLNNLTLSNILTLFTNKDCQNKSPSTNSCHQWSFHTTFKIRLNKCSKQKQKKKKYTTIFKSKHSHSLQRNSQKQEFRNPLNIWKHIQSPKMNRIANLNQIEMDNQTTGLCNK